MLLRPEAVSLADLRTRGLVDLRTRGPADPRTRGLADSRTPEPPSPKRV
jgi:hypothetical protein